MVMVMVMRRTQDDGESNERCDSRFFLVDLADPDGIWREGPSFPGECGLGQTMDTVNFTRGHAAAAAAGESGGEKSQVRVNLYIEVYTYIRSIYIN